MPYIQPIFRWKIFLHKILSKTLKGEIRRNVAPRKLLVIGAGNKVIPGWILSDIQGPAQVHLDLTRDWRINENFDAIFGEMVWGDFNREQLNQILFNCYTSLKPGGVLRICTLDFENLSKAYLGKSNKLQTLEVLRRNKQYGYVSDFPIDILFHATCGHYGMPKKNPRGSFLHDYEVFKTLLKDVGFSRIKKQQVSKSSFPYLSDLESRTLATEQKMQLCIEAVKL